jgi:hypothetical protein
VKFAREVVPEEQSRIQGAWYVVYLQSCEARAVKEVFEEYVIDFVAAIPQW